jgi:hypothetical protein
MFQVVPVNPSSDQTQERVDLLVQLPWAAFSQVLQHLDQRSLACTAMTCSTLRHAVPAAISKLEVDHRVAGTLGSFTSWLEGHCSSLGSLTQCSIACQYWGHGRPLLHTLTCPKLRQLHLQDFQVQLAPTSDHPGVLHACTGLRVLDLQDCIVMHDVAKASAAIAALPELQHLRLSRVRSAEQGRSLFEQQHFPASLSHLSLDVADDVQPTCDQLSGLVNLQHLAVQSLPYYGLRGGVPRASWESQLAKLTCLHLEFSQGCDNISGQLQHLSSLTALQQLCVECRNVAVEDVPGLGHLSQLTSLGLHSYYAPRGRSCRSSNISILTCLDALQRLSVMGCSVAPEALSSLTQLRALSLQGVECLGPGGAVLPLGGLIHAVSEHELLTELRVVSARAAVGMVYLRPVAAFTALTARTNLCSLQLGLLPKDVPAAWELCAPGVEYPRLRSIDLAYGCGPNAVPLHARHLQQLCSCCPAVESLKLALCVPPQLTAVQPLLQLSALTALQVCNVGTAAAAVVDVAAQLTGLKQLNLEGLDELAALSLLPLISLTALEELRLHSLSDGNTPGQQFVNKVRSAHLEQGQVCSP